MEKSQETGIEREEIWKLTGYWFTPGAWKNPKKRELKADPVSWWWRRWIRDGAWKNPKKRELKDVFAFFSWGDVRLVHGKIPRNGN